MTTAAGFGVLGPIEVGLGGRPIVVGRRKERALLALLLVAANRTVPLDRIVDLLWGDEAPDRAASSLHAYISNLRRVLEPDRPPRTPATRLVTRPPGYALTVQPDEVDAHRFEALAAEGRRAGQAGDLGRADSLLSESLGLWRGPAYGEFRDEPFALAEVLRLEELRATTVEDRMEVQLALGGGSAVIAEAEAVVSATPTRERAWGLLMVALYQSGRQADALRAFQRAREVLADASGIDPGPELRRLEAQILAQDPALSTARRTVARVGSGGAADPRPEPAGEPGGGLVGRRPELELLDGLLEQTRSGRGQVVLISGEAGVGKTALIAEMADRARRGGLRVAGTTWPETLDRPALAPWVQVLQQLGSEADAAAAQLREALVNARALTSSLVDQVVATIVAQASDEPTMIVCDDIQWASELSHNVVRRLTQEAPRTALLVALVCRQPATDEQPGLLTTLATMGRLPSVTRIDLHGLQPHEVIEMIAGATHVTPSSVIGTAIHEQTGGNAFYALELGRLLGAEGRLTAPEALEHMGVPATVRDVLRLRLSRLPDQAVTLLGIAAVLGNDVEPNLVRRVADVELQATADQLDLAEAAGFLQRHQSRAGRYRFAHELVRAAILDAMPSLHAASLHARAIDAISAVSGEHDAMVVHRLARHAVQAVEVLGPEQAAMRLERSAIVWRSMLNLERAVGAFGQALEHVAEMRPGRRRDGLRAFLVTRLAQTEFLVNGFDAGVRAQFAQALELSRTARADDRITVLLAYGSHALLFGAITEAIDAGAELLEFGCPVDSIATTGGRYLAGFDALRHPDPDADRRLLEGNDRDGDRVGVAPTIRAAASAFLDVLDGRVEAGRRRAVDVATRVVAADTIDGWIQAWSLTFTIPALVLLDDPDTVRAVTDRLSPTGPGIAHVDCHMDGCRSWARATAGEPGAYQRLTQARAELLARGDTLFWLILTLAAARIIVDDDADEAAALVAAASGPIEELGLDGLRPWLIDLPSRLPARS